MTQDTKLFVGADNPDIKLSDFKCELGVSFFGATIIIFFLYAVVANMTMTEIFADGMITALFLPTVVLMLWVVLQDLFHVALCLFVIFARKKYLSGLRVDKKIFHIGKLRLGSRLRFSGGRSAVFFLNQIFNPKITLIISVVWALCLIGLIIWLRIKINS